MDGRPEDTAAANGTRKSAGRASGRAGGRASRHRHRASPTSVANPAPPGATGGLYRPLSDHEVTRIIDAALTLLAELGMGEVLTNLTKVLRARQFSMTGRCRSRVRC